MTDDELKPGDLLVREKKVPTFCLLLEKLGTCEEDSRSATWSVLYIYDAFGPVVTQMRQPNVIRFWTVVRRAGC